MCGQCNTGERPQSPGQIGCRGTRRAPIVVANNESERRQHFFAQHNIQQAGPWAHRASASRLVGRRQWSVAPAAGRSLSSRRRQLAPDRRSNLLWRRPVAASSLCARAPLLYWPHTYVLATQIFVPHNRSITSFKALCTMSRARASPCCAMELMVANMGSKKNVDVIQLTSAISIRNTPNS